jgi:uncharacterized protein YciI
MKVSVFGCVLSVAVILGTMQPSFAADTPLPTAAKSTFLVTYRPGPSWLAGKPVSQQPLGEHFKYMVSLYAQGAMKFAGPFADDTGGAGVLEATSKEEAESLIAADPAVTAGVMTYQIHPWNLVPWDKYVKK